MAPEISRNSAQIMNLFLKRRLPCCRPDCIKSLLNIRIIWNFIFRVVAQPKWKAWLRKTLTRFNNSWYHAKTVLINCFIIQFLNNLPKKTLLYVCKSLRTRHERGAWKLGRLWTRDDNPTSAARIGYHVNLTRYVILIVCSRPTGRHEVLLPSLLELWQNFRSKLAISHLGSDKSDEEHSRLSNRIRND